MAKNGPNPTLQKMLEIIQDSSTHKQLVNVMRSFVLQQEQAASTPGLEHFAAVIAKARVLGCVKIRLQTAFHFSHDRTPLWSEPRTAQMATRANFALETCAAASLA